jgi:hypothetical protein
MDSSDSIMRGILIFMFFDIIFLILYFKNRNNNKQTIDDKLIELNSMFDKVIKLGYINQELNYVGFNNKSRTITIKSKEFLNLIIKYDDIVNVEYIENGNSTMSVGNVIGGAILAGSTGAIIGAMNKKQKITSRKIKFTLNNFNNPSFELDLVWYGLNASYGIDTMTEVNKLIDTLKYIINNKNII